MRMHVLAFPNDRTAARSFGDRARCACMCSASEQDPLPRLENKTRGTESTKPRGFYRIFYDSSKAASARSLSLALARAVAAHEARAALPLAVHRRAPRALTIVVVRARRRHDPRAQRDRHERAERAARHDRHEDARPRACSRAAARARCSRTPLLSSSAQLAHAAARAR